MEDWFDKEEARARDAKLQYDVLELVNYLFGLQRPVILNPKTISGGIDTVNEALDQGLIHVETDGDGDDVFQLTNDGLLLYWEHCSGDYFHPYKTAE